MIIKMIDFGNTVTGPMFVCETCDQPISDAHTALITLPGASKPLVVLHKRECVWEFERVNGGATHAASPWRELADFLGQLMHNSRISALSRTF